MNIIIIIIIIIIIAPSNTQLFDLHELYDLTRWNFTLYFVLLCHLYHLNTLQCNCVRARADQETTEAVIGLSFAPKFKHWLSFKHWFLTLVEFRL